MKEHELKTWKRFFEDIHSGKKNFEIRKDDRDFMEGDILILREWDTEKGEYTGRQCRRKVIFTFGLKLGWIAMELEER